MLPVEDEVMRGLMRDATADLFASIRFGVCDDLAKISVYELALDEVFIAIDTPAAVSGFEDGERNLAALLNDAAFADRAAAAIHVAFIDGISLLAVELDERLWVAWAFGSVIWEAFRQACREGQ